jgi:hypothetical protein
MTLFTVTAMTTALALAASAAAAAPKKHHYARHARAAAVAPVPQTGFGPARMYEARPGVFISSYGCIQDEGYGRWTYCGQGRDN